MSKKKPADILLTELLEQNNLTFVVRKQRVRYMDDNGMVIEPPTIVVMYKDDYEKSQRLHQETKEGVNG